MRGGAAIGIVLALGGWWFFPNAALGASPAVKEVIGQLRASDPAIRGQAAEALRKVPMWELSGVDGEDVATLASALSAKEAPVRQAAAQIFSLLTHSRRGATLSRSALEPLMAALRDPETSVAGSAAIALGHIRDRAALRPLIDALGDERGPVVGGAAVALGHLLDQASASDVVPALRHEKARRLVRGLFQQLGEGVPVAALVAALEGADPELRRGAAFVLEELGDRRATGALRHALKDHDGKIRASAAKGLGRIGDQSAASHLILLLQDPDPEVRLAGATALYAVGGREAVEPLIARLQDADASVRWEVISTLVKIGDSRAVKPLIALLGDDAMGDQLFHTVGHWQGNKEVVRVLIDALSSPNEQIQKRAAKALLVDNTKVRILGREAVGPLLPLLKSPQVEVRRTVAFTLQTLAEGRFLDQDVNGPLTEASKDDDVDVQRSAAKALELVRERQ